MSRRHEVLSRDRPGSHVTLTKTRAEKVFPIGDFHGAVEKSIWLHDIGTESGLFVSPAVLDFDPDRRLVSYARIDDLSSIVQAPDGSCARQIGRSIGAIHLGLDERLRSDPERWESSLREWPAVLSESAVDVPLRPAHGDAGVANFGTIGPDGTLVVLDPCPNMYSCHAMWSVEPVLFDLALAASHLVGRRTPFAAFIHPSSRAELVEQLLIGYDEVAGYSVDAERLRSFMRFVVKSYAFGYRTSNIGHSLAIYLGYSLAEKRVVRRVSSPNQSDRSQQNSGA